MTTEKFRNDFRGAVLEGESNYQDWGWQIKNLLRAKEMWGVVSGTELIPTRPDATPALIAAWNLKDVQALTQMISAISPSLLSYFRHIETSKDLWDAAKTRYAGDSMPRQMNAHITLYTKKLQSGESVSEHCEAMLTASRMLKDQGNPADDKTLKNCLVVSVYDVYETLMQSMENVADLTFEKIRIRLEQEELMKGRDGSGSASALRTNSRQQQRGRGGRLGDFRGRRNDNDSRGGISNSYSGSNNGNFGGGGGNFRGGEGVRGNRCGRRGGRNQRHDAADTCFDCKQTGHWKGDPNCPGKKYFGANSVQGGGHDTTQRRGDSNGKAWTVHSANSATTGGWCIDSGATEHMSRDADGFVSYRPPKPGQQVTVANHQKIPVHGCGDYQLQARVGQRTNTILLKDTLHVPDLSQSLLSVNAAMARGVSVHFNALHDQCALIENGRVEAVGARHGKQFRLFEDESPRANVAHASGDLWHKRFGHLHHDALASMKKEGLMTGFDYDPACEKSTCDTCVVSKQKRPSFPCNSTRQTKEVLQLIHSDVGGPLPVESPGGSKYYLTLIDDWSRYQWVIPMKHKSEVLVNFKKFVAQVERQTGKSVKTLRSDNGGEYRSREFDKFCENSGIKREFTAPYTPQQNGMAERLNQTLMNGVRALLHQGQMPDSMWAEAIATVAYLRNRSVTQALGKKLTPYARWHGGFPDSEHLRVWGCTAYVHVNAVTRTKLDARARKCRFVGYDPQAKAYRLWDPKRKKIVVSRDVTFDESNFGSEQARKEIPILNFGEKVEEINQPISDEEEHPEEQAEPAAEPPRRGNRNRHPPLVPDGQIACDWWALHTEIEADEHYAFHAESEAAADIPKSMSEAMSGPNARQWKEAATSEYNSLMSKKTWELMPSLPSGKNLVGSKWVFSLKRDAQGKVQRYKARMVARGFSQKEGIDYDEVFAPVVRFNTVRAILALAAQYDLEVDQLDVKTAYLNGYIDKEIYMKQPAGFEDPQQPEAVCLMKRSLYGLKQSGRCWNKEIDQFLRSLGYRKTSADPCIYVKGSGATLVFLSLYVDDVIIASRSRKLLDKEKLKLMDGFEMEDQGPIHHILGMAVTRARDQGKLYMSQEVYVRDMLKRFGMEECKPISTPMEINKKMVKLGPDDPGEKAGEYMAAIGCLLWLSMGTRPDIAQSVAYLAQYCKNPSTEHWCALKRVLRYLQGSKHLSMVYQKFDGNKLLAYSDADWAGDIEKRRSTSGFAFLLGGGAISWLSRLQPVVALSTTEAEYIALTSAAQEHVWLTRLFREIGFGDALGNVIYEDNQGAIHLARDPVAHKRVKHIEIRYHFIRDKVESGEIILEYCPTNDMVADIFTKALSRDKFQRFRGELGLQ